MVMRCHTECWYYPPQLVLVESNPPSSSSSIVAGEKHDQEESQQEQKMFSSLSPPMCLKRLVSPHCSPPSPPLTPTTSLSPSTSASSDVTLSSIATLDVPPPPQVSGGLEPPCFTASISNKRFNSCGNNNKRRSIFVSQVWNQTNPSKVSLNTDSEDSILSSRPTSVLPAMSPLFQQGNVSPPRRRVSRAASLDETAAAKEKYNDIRRMVQAPVNRCLDKPHFLALPFEEDSCSSITAARTVQPAGAETAATNASSRRLPDLPFPLRRFYQEGARTTLQGTYPLVSPAPILRPSSYGKPKQQLHTPTQQEQRQEQKQQQQKESPLCGTSGNPLLSSSMVNGLNMTDSIRIKTRVHIPEDLEHMEAISTTTSCSSSTSSEDNRDADEHILKHKVEVEDAEAPPHTLRQ